MKIELTQESKLKIVREELRHALESAEDELHRFDVVHADDLKHAIKRRKAAKYLLKHWL